MVRHYAGELGNFDYDDEEFEVTNKFGGVILQYRGKGTSVNLPKGCISTRLMFFGCDLPEGFTLGMEFDTSDVKDMRCMFQTCTLPNGFSLGDRFNTNKVEDMRGMFSLCVLPEGFTFGSKFNTCNVKDMYGMFAGATLPNGFSLGEQFDTSKVETMNNMFRECKLPNGFFLGNKFNVAKVIDKSDMFYLCTINNCPLEGTTEQIIELLKQPLNPSAPASESEVWKILDKSKYIEEFIPEAEKMYDFIKKLVDTCGNTTVDEKAVPTMQVFFDMWNNYSHETFRILDALVHKSDKSATEMNLF